MENWYVVQTKVKSEAIAEENLNNQLFSTFLPLLRVRRQRRGGWVASSEPMFPGYLFVELDLGRQDIAPIRSTRGVVRLVRLGETLRPFPDDVLDSLRQAQAFVGGVIDPSRLFDEGDEVRLLRGPMAGMTAIFKARNSQERVVLMLNMLGVETKVSVSPHNIAKAV